jgi:hypothetical protein
VVLAEAAFKLVWAAQEIHQSLHRHKGIMAALVLVLVA